FQQDLKGLGSIAVQGVIDDVAGALLKGQGQAKDGLLRHPLSLRELLQRLDGTHDLLRRGVQFQDHGEDSFPDRSTFKVRMAMSSDWGALPAKLRTVCSRAAVMPGAG